MSSGSAAVYTSAKWVIPAATAGLGARAGILADITKRNKCPRRNEGLASASPDLEGGVACVATRSTIILGIVLMD